MVLGQVHRKSAPAGANFNHLVSILDVSDLRHSFVFGLLSCLKRDIWGAEEPGRIGHRWVKPEAVELVGKVIVCEDVLLRTIDGPGACGLPEFAPPFAEPSPIRKGSLDFSLAGKDSKHVRPVICGPPSFDPSLCRVGFFSRSKTRISRRAPEGGNLIALAIPNLSIFCDF